MILECHLLGPQISQARCRLVSVLYYPLSAIQPTPPSCWFQLTQVSLDPKNKRNKKKKNAKARTNGDSAKPNGVKNDEEKVDHDADEEEQDTSDLCQPQSPTQADTDDRLEAASGMGGGFESSMKNYPDQRFMESNGEQGEASLPKPITQPAGPDRTKASSAQDGTRLEDMAREREALRDEVSYMRKSLEKIQERHEEEMGRIREQLSQTEEGREQAQTQYQNLLGKVNTIRSQLGERLKADAVGSPLQNIRWI